MLNTMSINFKQLLDFWYRFRFISLVIFLAFSISIFSPIFAQNSDEGIELPEDTGFVVIGIIGAEDNKNKDAEHESKLIDISTHLNEDAVNNPISLQGYYNQTDKNFGEYLIFLCESLIPSYLRLEGACSEIIKEGSRKALGKMVKPVFLPGNYKSASGPINAVNYVKRSPVDAVRDIRRSVKGETKNGNYEEAGNIIKTSVLSHIPATLAEEVMGYFTVMFLAYMEPSNAAMVKDYFWTQFIVGTFVNEVGTGTAETVLSFEQPENVYIPNLVKVITTAACFVPYNQLIGGNPVKILGVCEIFGSSASAIVAYKSIKNDPKFEKYKIFDFDNYGVEDFKDSAKELYNERGIKGFRDSIIPTITEASNMLMDGYVYGGNAYKVRGLLSIYFNIINSVSAGNAKQSNKLLSDALARNATPEEISEIKNDGIIVSALNAIPNAVPALFCYFFGPRFGIGDGTSKIVNSMAIEQIASFTIGRMITEQTKAFNPTEEDKVYTFLSHLRAGVNMASLVLMKSGKIKANISNRSKVQIINYILIFAPIVYGAL